MNMLNRFRQWLGESRRNQFLAAGAALVIGGTLAAVGVVVAVSGDGDGDEQVIARTASPSPAVEAPTRTPRRTATASPPPEPETTPTAAAEAPGWDGFRAFATQVSEALANRDVEFFSGRAVVKDYTCTGQEEFTQACWDQQPGTMVQTFGVGFLQSEGLAMTITYYSDRFTEWFSSSHSELSDEYGGGKPILHSLARTSPDQTDSETYLAIATGIVDPTGQGPHRQVRISRWRFTDGSWRLTSESIGGYPGAITDWLSGDCVECYDQWERWAGASQ